MGVLSALSSVTVLWGIVNAVLIILVHIAFAIAVYRDAIRLDRVRTLIIAGPGIWSIATLVGGVVTAAIYWAMHHSRLNPDIPMASTETEEGSA
ncbi:hypothetical protein F4054_05995 [Candidatus Poribacteria bacterium]|nr:hypothetical protein [Candidatus Poribacteria bacterium]MYG07770.1 hypothetical protein [Candidatus Poribacteria bacterium]MYK21796.1 hypothetical protein [Candidatus Poribacteria bacterium]